MGLNRPISRLAAWTAGKLPPDALQSLYRLGPISRLLRAALNRSVPLGLTEVAVAGGQLAGVRLLLDLRVEKDLWLGSYEPSVLAALEQLVRQGMTVYDVGAHIGYMTLHLARLVGVEGRVVAFEPLPANLERLRAHLALNPVGERVLVVPTAVGETGGRQRFSPHASVAMGKLAGGEAHGAGLLEVEVLSLDEYRASTGSPPAVVKIDIEGGEVAALKGMQRALREDRPVVLVETHSPEAGSGTWDVLRAAGYHLHRLDRGYPEAPSAGAVRPKDHLLGLPPDAQAPDGWA